ncbi:DUF4153 domain-containing protein [uncultured Bacteroides sp.]|uniref:DUF4153 domain-containing protein n=1 Tax=uncultured Bacteroides sp. TaxID=162156 RepID=UPI00262B191D|nr:DUF4153 domain-containing protein [uncultured Bacteroides sp.]
MAVSVKKAFHKAVEAFRICWRRFPVTVFFLCALTAHFLYFIKNEGKGDETLQGVLTYYFTIGTLLSLTLHLWSEEVKNRRLKLTVQGVAHILLLTDAAYIYHLIHAKAFFVETGLAHASLLLALTILLFYLPFWREKNDVASNKFAQCFINSFFITQLVGLLLWSGLSLLLTSLEELFGIHIGYKCNFYIGTLCCTLLAPMIFLGLLPQGERKHDRIPQPSCFWNNALRYLFLPLTAGYLAVLYAYAIRILVTWELPNGWVSGLVTALMALTIALEFGLYSVRLKENRRFDQRIAHLLPLLVLPLLLLMTVGIARRLNDYGVTLNRLYLATLNGWFYLICIGLFVTKARRIHWIPLSFAAIFMLTSALPVNYVGISRSYLLRKVEATMTNTYQGTLPMSDEQYLDWLKTLPQEEALAVNSRLKKLDDFYCDKNIQRFVSKDVRYWAAEDYIKENSVVVDTVVVEGEDDEEEIAGLNDGSYSYGQNLNRGVNTLDISEGYTKLVLYDNANDTLHVQTLKPDTLAFPLCADVNEATADTAYVSLQDLRKWDKLYNLPPQALRCNRAGDKFMLTYFYLGSYTDYTTGKHLVRLRFSGIHLKK